MSIQMLPNFLEDWPDIAIYVKQTWAFILILQTLDTSWCIESDGSGFSFLQVARSGETPVDMPELIMLIYPGKINEIQDE